MKKSLFFLCFVIALMLPSYSIGDSNTLDELYASAELLMVQGDYSGAAAQFDALGSYSDASKMAMYCKAISLAEELGYYDMAINTFIELNDFKDSEQMAEYYKARKYESAGIIDIENASNDDLSKAVEALDKAEETYSSIPLFKDCFVRIENCKSMRMAIIYESQERKMEIKEKAYLLAISNEECGKYQAAYALYQSLQGYKDCSDRMKAIEDQVFYLEAESYCNKEDYESAINCLNKVKQKTSETQTLLEKSYEGLAIQSYYSGNIDAAVVAISMLSNKSKDIIEIQGDIDNFKKKYSDWLGKWSYTTAHPKCSLWIRAQYQDGLTLAFETGKTQDGDIIFYDLYSYKKNTIVYHSGRFSVFNYTTLHLVKEGVLETSTKMKNTGTTTSKTRMYKMEAK